MNCTLPPESHLLREIFHSLESVSRVKLRRVCWLWNSVLTGADSGHTVWVSFRNNLCFPMKADKFIYAYAAVAGLIKCIDGSTQRLIVARMHGEQLDGALAVVKWMLRHNRIQQLIFHDVEFEWRARIRRDNIVGLEDVGQGILHRLAAAFRDLAPLCDGLRLRMCKFKCFWRTTATIADGTVALDAADIEAQLWDLYEASLSRDGLDFGKMAEWIRTGSLKLRSMVAQYLNDYQSCDARLTTRYREQTWTVDDLKDLDVSTLTIATLRALKDVLPRELKFSIRLDKYRYGADNEEQVDVQDDDNAEEDAEDYDDEDDEDENFDDDEDMDEDENFEDDENMDEDENVEDDDDDNFDDEENAEVDEDDEDVQGHEFDETMEEE
ncbi:putative uncharacterized protein DDB_G0285495 [Paramacrobiotus metropolitanus]|uniref:putative uncharacterized protein DDB_G0285495 n=1 Tax=Paramacrobiotus metropolitanus TaxID=2943436 RepID=UPI002445F7A4|nr:putative uncharacterized protein DDB_G0285495 [Paramacrobiotus metropolitanus]